MPKWVDRKHVEARIVGEEITAAIAKEDPKPGPKVRFWADVYPLYAEKWRIILHGSALDNNGTWASILVSRYTENPTITYWGDKERAEEEAKKALAYLKLAYGRRNDKFTVYCND